MKKYSITLEGGFLFANSEIVIEATHYSEGANLVYFYNAKENITIDNVICAIGAAKILLIKEII